MNNSNKIWKLPNNFKVPFKVFDTLEYDKRKIVRTKLTHLLYIPIILLIFFLKKLNIRLMKYPEYFGHQNFDMEHFYRIGKKQRCIYIFMKNKIVINEYLFQKHKNRLLIIQFSNKFFKLIENIDKISLRNFGLSIFDIIGYEYKKIQIIKKNWDKNQPLLKFSVKDENNGKSILKEIGLEKQNFVLFASRDKEYYIDKNLAKFNSYSKSILTHEEAKIQSFRNTDFYKYKQSINFFSKQKIKSVRIGAKQKPVLINNKSFYDYSGTYRANLGKWSSFFDIYLLHNCKFMISGNVGINAAIVTTNNPLLIVNNFPWPWLHFSPRNGDYFMPKLLTNKLGYKYSIRDMISLSKLMDWRTLNDKTFFDINHGLIPIENTEEEIFEASKEFYFRYNNKWKENKNEMELRKKFQKLLSPDIHLYYVKSKIPFSFLNKYKNLI